MNSPKGFGRTFYKISSNPFPVVRKRPAWSLREDDSFKRRRGSRRAELDFDKRIISLVYNITQKSLTTSCSKSSCGRARPAMAAFLLSRLGVSSSLPSLQRPEKEVP